jgi:hypothetical protein
MSTEDFDTNLTNEELTRVHNALDALSTTTETPNSEQWRTIMEESKKRGSLSNKTKILSIAASVLLVAGIAAAVITTQSSDPDQFKTVNKKPVDVVDTKPLNVEEALLADTLLFKSDTDIESTTFSGDIYDNTGKLIAEPPSFNEFGYDAPRIAAGKVNFRDSDRICGDDRSTENETVFTGLTYDIARKSYAYIDDGFEVVSPSGKKTAKITLKCNYESTLTITGGEQTQTFEMVLGKTYTSSTVDGEGYETRMRTSVQSVIWVDDTQLLVETREVLVGTNNQNIIPTGQEDGEADLAWRILDLNEDTSLLALPLVPGFEPVCCAGGEEFSTIFDVIDQDGKKVILTRGTQNNAVNVRDLSTGDITDTIPFSTFGSGEVFAARFGSSSNEVYGSNGNAFGYARSGSTLVQPNGKLLLKIK